MLKKLDRFYIHISYSAFKIHLTEVHKYSDHLVVVLDIGKNREDRKKRKSAYWKLNNTQLKRAKDKEAINRLITICREEIDNCHERAVEIWMSTKYLIKSVSQELAIRESKKKREKTKEILTLLETTKIGTERRTMVQKELDDMEEERYRGAPIKCKVDMEQEDISTKHFLAREQNVHRNINIKEIKKKERCKNQHR